MQLLDLRSYHLAFIVCESATRVNVLVLVFVLSGTGFSSACFGSCYLVRVAVALSLRVVSTAGKGVDIYTRKQALLFLHVCLASVLNLRSPDDSQLPGSQLDKLVDMLFGDHDHPHIEPTSSDAGVKTKTQLLAERHVLKQLLSTAVGAAADTDLAVDATPFAHGVCRHFAMLFAAGCSTPKSASWQQPAGSQSPEVMPGGPPSGPPTGGSAGSGGPTNAAAGEPDGRGKASKSQALKELDAHLFFDALVEVAP